jgi:HK97 family phage major capsid protein
MSIESQVAVLEAAAEALNEQCVDIESSWGTDRSKMPAGQAERHERLTKGALAKAREAEDLIGSARVRAEKIEAIRLAAQDPRNIEHGADEGRTDGQFAQVGRNRANPWLGLGETISRSDSPDGLRARALDAVESIVGVPHAGREKMARLIDNIKEQGAAELVLAGSDPHYRTAFEKILVNPITGHLMWTAEEQMAYQRTEHSRAALSLTGANGGYLVPFTLDPSIVLTNAGAANPFRQISRMETTATNDWNGVASAGVTAQWLAEAGVAADATPSFSQVKITPQKAAAWIFGSVEAISDTDFAVQLPTIVDDAKAVIENTAFSVGTGTGQPLGVVTAATTTVTTAAVATFAVADVYALQAALPPRARHGVTPAVVGNVTQINRMRQFDTAGGSSYWTNLGQGAPPEILGLRLAEASGMASTITTGSKIAVAGDFAKMVIVDRLGLTVQFSPVLLDQATGRPNGSSGWFCYWRVGSGLTDVSQFRTLVAQ